MCDSACSLESNPIIIKDLNAAAKCYTNANTNLTFLIFQTDN